MSCVCVVTLGCTIEVPDTHAVKQLSFEHQFKGIKPWRGPVPKSVESSNTIRFSKSLHPYFPQTKPPIRPGNLVSGKNQSEV